MPDTPTTSEPPATNARFLDSLRRLFSALPTPRGVAEHLDVAAAAVAATLERRARRRRARFDLFLREAPPQYAADLALALRAQQGDVAAVTELRRLVLPVVVARIHAAGLHRHRDELADDVVRHLWEKIGRYNGRASLKTWGGTVIQNYLRNWIRDLRTREARQVVLEDDAGHERRPSPHLTAVGGPDVDTLQAERTTRVAGLAGEVVRLARRALTPAEWELIQQVVIDGTPYADIGVRRGVKSATLRVQLFRAVEKLQAAALAEHGEDFGDDVLDALEPE